MPTSAIPLVKGSARPFQSMAARRVSAFGSEIPTLNVASPHSIDGGGGLTNERSGRMNLPRTASSVEYTIMWKMPRSRCVVTSDASNWMSFGRKCARRTARCCCPWSSFHVSVYGTVKTGPVTVWPPPQVVANHCTASLRLDARSPTTPLTIPSGMSRINVNTAITPRRAIAEFLIKSSAT